MAHAFLTRLGIAAALAASLAPGATRPAQADDGTSLAAYRHASACVAVMKQDVVELAARYQAGDTAVRPDMVRLTALGFAFIGTAYKQGLRKPQADTLLAEAEQEQLKQRAGVLRQLSADCQAEGAQLLDDSNFLERALVNNRAQARVDKLLAPRRPAP